MGYLVCNKTVKPKETDGNYFLATTDDIDILTEFTYNESKEISDVKDLSMKEAKDAAIKRQKILT